MEHNGEEVDDMNILKKIRDTIENIRAAYVMAKVKQDEVRKDKQERGRQ